MVRKGLAGGSFKPLTEESIDRVYQTAMRIIEEVGFEVNSETALELFERAGARVDRERRLVCLPQEKALELIRTAPSEIILCGQDEKDDIILSGNRVYAGTGGTALYIYQPDNVDWSLDDVASQLGEHAGVSNNTSSIIDNVLAIVKAGDHVLIMSNGGFEGIHERLIAKLQSTFPE